MKRFFDIILITGLAVIVCFLSCRKETSAPVAVNIVPVQFKVDIPSAINYPAGSDKLLTIPDSVNGYAIYQKLRFFVSVGDSAASIIQAMMTAIGKYNITKPMQLSYKGKDDSRAKLLVETDNVTFEGTSWQHSISITDIIDSALAMKIFWNLNPVSGIAILKPYEINKSGRNLNLPNTLYRIDYSEAGTGGYNAQMKISLSGLPPDTANEWAINNLKFFVGRQGNLVDVYGNSNHPHARLLIKNYIHGFNVAFAASCDKAQNTGVAEIGLLPCDFSIYKQERYS